MPIIFKADEGEGLEVLFDEPLLVSSFEAKVDENGKLIIKFYPAP